MQKRYARARDKFMADTILRQLSDADIILLNKTDLVSAEQLIDTRNWLMSVANGAQVVNTRNAAVSPAIVLHDFAWSKESESQPLAEHRECFETHSLPMHEAVDPALFIESLLSAYPQLIRAKGFVKDLKDNLKTLQIVGKRATVSDAPQGVKTGLVVIQRLEPRTGPAEKTDE